MKELKQLLPEDVLLVESPDHPFAFDGPDYLLSSREGLVGLFVLRKNESNNLIKMTSRVRNSIIAYPALMKTVFLFDPGVSIRINLNKFLSTHFNEVMEHRDLRKISLFLKDRKPESRLKDIKHQQSKLFKLQSVIQRDNIEYIKLNDFREKDVNFLNGKVPKAKFWNNSLEKEIVVRSNVFDFQGQVVGSKKLSPKVSDLKELIPFYDYVLNSEFDFSEGIPFINYLSRKALNVSDVPSLKSDSLKPVRIASLFGWHLVNSSHIDIVLERISKYKGLNGN